MPVCGYVVKSLVWTVESAAQKILFISASFLRFPCASFLAEFARRYNTRETEVSLVEIHTSCEKKITP